MAKTAFETLHEIDFTKHIKVLQKNKYIPWSDAWYEVKKAFPLARYDVKEDDIGNPFIVSPMGIFVKVTVTIGDEAQSINYPVLNGANKALKAKAYSYKVKEYKNGATTGKFVDKYVEAATSFDINTAIMRALTKCLALMGAALYVYRDELTPELTLVSSHQLQEIQDACTEYGITLSYVAKAWSVGTISELYSMNFEKVIVWIKSHEKTN